VLFEVHNGLVLWDDDADFLAGAEFLEFGGYGGKVAVPGEDKGGIVTKNLWLFVQEFCKAKLYRKSCGVCGLSANSQAIRLRRIAGIGKQGNGDVYVGFLLLMGLVAAFAEMAFAVPEVEFPQNVLYSHSSEGVDIEQVFLGPVGQPGGQGRKVVDGGDFLMFGG
jgi:hypothetical protein